MGIIPKDAIFNESNVFFSIIAPGKSYIYDNDSISLGVQPLCHAAKSEHRNRNYQFSYTRSTSKKPNRIDIIHVL